MALPDKNLNGFPKPPVQDIPATRIVNATLTGTQVASNISLPGTTVKAGGQIVVVANTNSTASLSIIRGTVSSTGTQTSGEGLAASSKTATGRYSLTWLTAFADAPAFVVTPGGNLGDALMASVSSVTTTGALVTISNSAGANADNTFHFVAIGLKA